MWVSGGSTNLFLIDSDGNTLDHRTDEQNLSPGSHTEIYCSQLSGDMLVLMKKYIPSPPVDDVEAKIVRFNGLEETQTVQFDAKGNNLYIDPECITENRNGDIIVFDLIHDILLGPSSRLVVTDQNGSNRFTYYGSKNDPRLKLEATDICTDALSNILIANQSSSTVHMIDKDGIFLCLLLTTEHGIRGPWGMSYDEKSHRLWVGSIEDNRLCVYRYIERQNHFS
ncbi:uncharacterized protein LOC134281065 [Saccostrea cucullata]|uniref:uncharacterized protein LOC134281065 n=1 Tax=Saccostrea cuccullata TaxID=36930 RepID=UPI002ED11DDC